MKRLILSVTVLMMLSYGYLSATSVDTRGTLIVLRNAHQLTQVGTLGGDRIYDLTWSPDGRWLAVVGSRSVYVYDSDDLNAPPKQIAVGGDEVWTASFTPDGRMLVVNGVVWEIEPFGQYTTFEVMYDYGIDLQMIAFHPEGRLMASSLTYSGIGVLDVDPDTFELSPRSFGVPNSTVASLSFSHSGEQLMITSAMLGTDRYEFAVQYPLGNFGIWIWQVDDLIRTDQHWTQDEAIAQGALLQLEGHPEGVRQGVFSSDDRLLATAGLDGTVRLWDTTSGERLLSIDAHYEAAWDVDFSADDSQIASVGWDATLKTWDSATGNSVDTYGGYQTVLTAVAYSPDGEQMAVGGWDGRVWIRNTLTNDEVLLRNSHFWEHWDVDFSPDDYYLAVAADNNEIWIWDLDDGAEYRGLHGHEGPVQAVDYSPDGTRLVSGSMDQTVRLWDVERGQELMRFHDHHSSVKRVLFSPDGDLIAASGHDGTIHFWDSESGALRYTLQGESYRIAFSIDGEYFAAGDKVWRLNDRTSPHQVSWDDIEHSEQYFQNDSYNLDGTIQITESGFIDMETHEYIIFNDRYDPCRKRDMAFNHEGSLVAIACDDGDIQLWGIGQ